MKNMKRLSVKLLVVALAGLFAFGALADDSTTDITQGEFAVLLAGRLVMDAPGGAWTVQSAVDQLTGMDIVPLAGNWDTGAVLTEGDLVHVGKFFGISAYTETPDAAVSVSKAKAFFYKYSTFFKTSVPTTFNNDPETSTHIFLGVGTSDAPGAPESPMESYYSMYYSP